MDLGRAVIGSKKRTEVRKIIEGVVFGISIFSVYFKIFPFVVLWNYSTTHKGEDLRRNRRLGKK
jgi:hypothetical protein